MGYIKTAQRRYLLEIMAAGALLLAAGWLKTFAIRHTADPVLLLAVKLLQLLPILLIALAVWRYYRNRDELQRQTMLKTSAAAGLLSLIVFMSYPTLSTLGLPPLSPKAIVFLLSGSYILCGAVISFLGFTAESGPKQAVVRMLPLLFMLVLLLALYLVLPAPSMPLLRGLIWLAGVAVVFGIYRLLSQRVDP
jgi:hypothetical protein